MDAFWQRLIYNNTVQDWLISLSIIVISIIFLRFFQSIFINRIKLYAAKTQSTIDDFLSSIIQSSCMPILYALAFYVGLKYIDLPERAGKVERMALLIFVTYFFLRIVSSTIRYFFNMALKRKEQNDERGKQAKGILLIIQVIVWIGGFLFLVDNLGYDITTLVAGLGIGGIAIALAAQTILGDLFSYIVIFFDKPFEIGDFIIVEDKLGTVEYIGIKTTRLKTLNGEQLIISNTDLTNSRVHNYKRMKERRAVFSFGIVYNTPAAKLKIIPQMLKRIVEKLENTRFDRAHFQSFGDFSLNFEVVYYVTSPEMNIYLDIQQTINVSLVELFEGEGIDFAFPTQTVFLNKVNHEEEYSA